MTSAPDDIQLLAPPPAGAQGGAAQTFGQTGIRQYYYWIVARYPIGVAVSGPVFVRNAPNALSAVNYVLIVWNASPGALTYDVLRTDSNQFPQAPGNYALVTGLTNTEFTDQGQLLVFYDMTGLPWGSPVSRRITLNNRDYTQPTIQINAQLGVTQLIFRDGTVQDTAGVAGALYVRKSGDTMTGPLILSGNPTDALEATTKEYVDTQDALLVPLAGGTMTGVLILASNPVAPLQAATKAYVDTSITGVLVFVGAIDATTGDCNFTAASGLPDGPLPPAASVPNRYVICAVSGTIPSGPAMGITLNRGDWLLSDGIDWHAVPVGGQIIVASAVGVVPPRFGADNVQDALTNAEVAVNARVLKTGDTMTGRLTAPGFTSSADGDGLFTFGGGRFYKASATGLIIRQSNGNQQPQIEDNDGSNRRSILDANNGVRKSGDTMTGGLVINSVDGLRMNNGWTYIRKNDNGYGGTPGAPLVQDAAGRRGYQMSGLFSGNYVGGNPECAVEMYAMIGGHGWHKFMNSTINSPVQTQWEGVLNAPGFNNTSDIALKQDIEVPSIQEFARAFASLQPKKFRRRPVAPAESQTVLSPVGRWEYGFVAQDIERGAPIVVTGQDGVKGYSITDVLAIAVAKIRELEERLAVLQSKGTPQMSGSGSTADLAPLDDSFADRSAAGPAGSEGAPNPGDDSNSMVRPNGDMVDASNHQPNGTRNNWTTKLLATIRNWALSVFSQLMGKDL